MTKKLIILKAGSKLPSLAGTRGDFEEWILEPMVLAEAQYQVISIDPIAPLPELDTVAGVVVTGSSAMVTDGSDWIEHSAAWLKTAVQAGTPVLGICFGHQLLAYALGGEVADNPAGIEVGTVFTKLHPAAAADPLLQTLPRGLPVQASHKQAVLNLPEQAIRLASSEMDQNHAFRYGEQAWGVQFHPEFSRDIVRAYIAYYAEALSAQGVDHRSLLETSREASLSQQILERFARLVFPKNEVLLQAASPGA